MGLDDDDSTPKQVDDAPLGSRATGQNDFEFGLCSCFSDCEICLCSWCCPCIQFGHNWERLNPHNDAKSSDTFLVWCCAYFWAIFLADYFFFLSSTLLRWWARVEFRRALGYRERHVYDFLSACCCWCCMLAQDGNEIKAFRAGKLG